MSEFSNEFTYEDKKGCIKTIHKILNFAEVSRQQGILALESMVDENDDFL